MRPACGCGVSAASANSRRRWRRFCRWRRIDASRRCYAAAAAVGRISRRRNPPVTFARRNRRSLRYRRPSLLATARHQHPDEMRNIANHIPEPVLQRIDVAVFNVTCEIGFVADEMLPEPTLPDATLIACCAHGVE